MKYPQLISLWHTNGELLPGNVPSRVVLSSVGTNWNDVVVEQHHFPSSELADVMFKRHVIAINIGHSLTNEFKIEGRFQRVFKERGANSFFPSHRPFFLRLKVERGVFANVLFIAMALRDGVQSGAAHDRMYGEGLSTALAVHLLREYGAAVLGPKRQYGRLPREKLVRAVEYIQDQLDTDLTVSGIAQAVRMSPDHFTRVFKESTGQSPYQYVVDARVKKARELLTTGNFTISEVARQVGFADQSHLTRHFKRVFGLPPKRLLESQKAKDCGLRV